MLLRKGDRMKGVRNADGMELCIEYEDKVSPLKRVKLGQKLGNLKDDEMVPSEKTIERTSLW